ncbi:DUF6318 family protein [Arthrobacter bambusae]|uniref:DUF6318 domain-containing protein n=1 Tax=Arthrobacter bambusae TaxID=1338426 RepID=A0AAW8DAK2_9MICC|nr:DUF6318 family protein [Arthrobacter bambusae]MDP9905936.1 hypothetical protein [Arthrobacter bambusae]MDQ0130167.1 hypothetical protein [Arthrobacter bambusae]MDQ0181547.1 hypothetical protein [Arthrobacter bambusae]
MTPRTSVSARFFMIVSLGTALTLTACGNTTQPQSASPTDSASASASVTGAPSPTSTAVYKPADAKGKAENVPVPVLPEAAKANTKEGVEAFARYWFQALSYAYETGDTTAIKRATGPSCVFCNGLQESIGQSWADGKWIVGGRIETPVVAGKPGTGPESRQATVQVIQQQIEIRKADGTLYQEATEASNSGSQLVATFSADGWMVTDLGLIR